MCITSATGPTCTTHRITAGAVITATTGTRGTSVTKDELVPKIHNVPTKHVRFSRELVESADHAYLTCDGKCITIHATNGDYVYRITGYDDDTRYYDTELFVISDLSA